MSVVNASPRPPERARALDAYASGAYRSVEGWGVDDDLIPLFLALDEAQYSAGIVGNLLEIGVHHGRSFILLALMARPGERSFAVDLFEDQDRNLDQSGRGDSSAFEWNLRLHAHGADVETIAGDSLFLDMGARGITSLRFAHIDGAHYVDAVVSDLMKVQQAVVPGGVVIVDDFMHSGFPGANEGCHRYLSMATPRLLVPFGVGKNKLFLTTHSHRTQWLSALTEAARPQAERPVLLHGFDVVCVDPH
jgi:hypothetical protein